VKLVVGSDHGGYSLKEEIAAQLRRDGHDVLDVGTNSAESVDYPDFAEAVGKAMIGRRAERGVLICGSGVGASVAANKIPGIRAAICHDVYSAHQGVEHDDMNVLVLGDESSQPPSPTSSCGRSSGHTSAERSAICAHSRRSRPWSSGWQVRAMRGEDPHE
jgi:RpiB/LacA/LacB family sugar-phosphate isomerase